MVLALFSGYLILMAWLGVLLVSRYQYQDGVTAYKLERYDEAFDHLNGALGVLPQGVAALLAPRDLFRIRTALGKTLYKQGLAAWRKQEIAEEREPGLPRVYDLLEKAHGFLAAAVAHDPLSYRTVFWFARVTKRLETLFPFVHGRQVALPFNALPLFRQAAALRPAGITVRYELARYFYKHRRLDDLGDTVENIGKIYPSARGYLKKQTWFDTTIRERFQQGCLFALDQGINPRTTLSILSDMALDQGDLEGAIDYYRRSMGYHAARNSAGVWHHLAGLYLQKGDVAQSYPFFFRALLGSDGMEKGFKSVYETFRREKRLDDFLGFVQFAEKNRVQARMSPWLQVRCFMDVDDLESARAVLLKINTRKPTARAWYLLAQIAERQKNFDAMELASQRATVLDSQNKKYRAYFIKARKRNGKNGV